MSIHAGSDESRQDDPATGWRRSEDEAVALARHHGGLAIVDLDETLYLRNSTEQFVALAAPGFVAALILRLLDMASPWRWTGGSDCRDNWRLLAVMLLFPWTLYRWSRFCRREAPRHFNAPLLAALVARPGGVVIASNGYRRVITPLFRSLAIPGAQLICCDLHRFSHRTLGKLELVRPWLAPEAIAGATVITDSAKDGPLLAVCGRPCLTVWRDAVFERAFRHRAYLPGDYLRQVKRPRQGALKRLLREDLLPWVLAGLAARPTIAGAAGLAILFFSMWCFYEYGYYDNDQCALRYEEDGRTNPEAQTLVAPGLPARMIGTGIVLGLIGSVLVAGGRWPVGAAAWFGAMALLVLLYRWYNRVDKNTRAWLYLPLQAFRSGAMFVVSGGTAVGYALAGSQMVARWMDYVIYRYARQVYGSSAYPQRPQRMTRLMLLLLMLLPLILAGDPWAFAVPATLGIVLCLYDAVQMDSGKIRRGYARIDQDGCGASS